METKYVRVPFEVELAKKITNGECDGRIATRNGESVRILCFDRKGTHMPIIALVEIKDGEEDYLSYYENGHYDICDRNSKDLMLEIPEYMTFKDGDVLISSMGNPFIFNGRISKYGNFGSYCGINSSGDLVLDSNEWTMKVNGYANEKQKNILIGHLNRDWGNTVKEYLERFFGVEQKQEYEFKPFDKVLVKGHDEDSEWRCDLFSRKNEDGLYICVGSIYEQCILYEGNEHLLGTTENYE